MENNANISVQDVYNNYQNNAYRNTDDYPKGRSLPDTHVFNEELSVKANRELVKEHNLNLQATRDAYRAKSGELEIKLRADAVAALMCEYDLTQNQAELVDSFAFQEKHSSTSDYIQSLYEYGDLAQSLLKTK